MTDEEILQAFISRGEIKEGDGKDVGDELHFVLGIMSTDDKRGTVDEVLERVRYVFFCEWDCSIKGWFDGTLDAA